MRILFIASIAVLIVFAGGCDEMQDQAMQPMTTPDKQDTPVEPDVPKEDTPVETDVPKEDTPVSMEDTPADTDDPKEDTPVEPVTPVAAFVSATPASGDISENDSISVNFDNDPGDVTTSAGTVAGTGNSRTISGPFPVGALALTIMWTNGDGSHTLNYNVIAPDVTPPEVTASSPADGAEDVDPVLMFEQGITVTFDEPVTGDLMVTADDVDVGWTSTVGGNTITLTANAGQELSYGTMYEIVGTVSDGAGNEVEVEITFATESAPVLTTPEIVMLDPGEGLAIGSGVPEFELPDGNGDEHTLSDYISRGPVVLVFYRYSG